MSAHGHAGPTAPCLTLLTDFGAEDTFVGVVKGVILSIAPGISVVDLTHGCPRHDIRSAAFHLAAAIRFFPPGTVHLVVIDPGVGGERRAIAVETETALYVAPDNGVLTFALQRDHPRRAVHLTRDEYRLANVSATFHGRDVFAPAAAYLARGVPILDMGEEINDLVKISIPLARLEDEGVIRGQVQHIDHFGNCITNIPETILQEPGNAIIEVGSHVINGMSPSYSAVAPGIALALTGSSGYLEVAVREGSAAEQLDLKRGDPISYRNPA